MASTHTPEFTRIFEENSGLVFRTAYRITGNAADAEDVLQTIFLRLLRRTTALPAIEKTPSYFRRAAINASLDLLRSRHAEPTVAINKEPGEAPVNKDPGEAPASTLELRECLRRAMLTLSPRAAEMFALRYLEDFTTQQIAEALNVSQIVVGVTLHRARRQLQKEIRSYFGGQL